MVVVHDKAEGVAAGATAEAVVELFVGADAEGGGFLFVKRAAGAVILAGFFQLYARTHHVDDVGAVEEVVDKRLGNQAGHRGSGYCSKAVTGRADKTKKLRPFANLRSGVVFSKKRNARPRSGIVLKR